MNRRSFLQRVITIGAGLVGLNNCVTFEQHSKSKFQYIEHTERSIRAEDREFFEAMKSKGHFPMLDYDSYSKLKYNGYLFH